MLVMLGNGCMQQKNILKNFFKIEYNEVNKILQAYSAYGIGNEKLFFTANHDENSWNGTEYEKYGKAAKAMAVFTCTWQGMPLIYSGQENSNEKRLLFFDKDELVWKNPTTLHQFYKTLLHLHTTNAIAVGETFFITSNFKNVIIFFKRYKEEVVLVLLNFSEENKLKINITHDWLKGNFYNVFTGINFHFNNDEQFELQGFEYRVYTNTPLIQ
jgi:glycosidase